MFSGCVFGRGSIAAGSDCAPGQYVPNLAGIEGDFKQEPGLKGLRLQPDLFYYADSVIPKPENAPGSKLPLKGSLPERWSLLSLDHIKPI